MNRSKRRFACALAPLMLLWSAPRGQSAPEADAEKKPAVIVVRVPAKAELTIGGKKTKQQSEVREFDTPPLVPGKKFSYSVIAVWKDGDRDEKRETTVIVQAGETKEINFLESKPPPPPVERIPAPELILESERETVAKSKTSEKNAGPKLEPEPKPKPEPEPKPEVHPAPKEPFVLSLPETLNLHVGESKLLPIKVVRADCQGPVCIKFEGLPAGVELKETTIAADKQKGYILAAALSQAEEKEWEVKVIGVSGSIRQDHSLKIKIVK
jgi:uncharacterized protein (TIGR03000 family)